MDLKINTLMTHYVSAHDLQQFLTHHADTLIEISDADHDSDHFFNVDGQHYSKMEAEAKWEDVVKRGYVSINDIGKVLHRFFYAGKILGGLYAIQVSW